MLWFRRMGVFGGSTGVSTLEVRRWRMSSRKEYDKAGLDQDTDSERDLTSDQKQNLREIQPEWLAGGGVGSIHGDLVGLEDVKRV